MNKNTLTHYGWLVAVIVIIAILISLATPFGSVIRASIEGAVGDLKGVAQNAFTDDPPALDFGDLDHVNDDREGPVLASQQDWYKGSASVTSITEINILKSYTPEGEAEVWNADAENSGSIKCYLEGTKLTIAGDGSESIKINSDSANTFSGFTAVTNIENAHLLNMSEATSLNRFFYNCKALQSVDVSKWDTGSVTDLTAMCYNCYALETFDVGKWNTSNFKTIEAAFYMRDGDNNVLTSLDVRNWDTSKVTSTKHTFHNLKVLSSVDVSKWDVSQVTDMASMFSDCSSLTGLDVSKWNLTGTTDISFMFWGCSSLGTLDVADWDVSDVTTFDHLFAHSRVSGIDVSKWDTSSATNMYAMFHTVQNETIDVSSFDTSKVTAFGQMFESNHKLTKIYGLENFDTSQGVDFDEMFRDCPVLRELDLSSFDTRKATDGVAISPNGSKSRGLNDMISDGVLHKIKLGANFVFEGDGTTAYPFVMPKPSTGTWYTADGTAYAPEDVQSGTTNTYYFTLALAEQDKTPDPDPKPDPEPKPDVSVQKSGAIISATDVSSTSHNLAVSLVSDTVTDFSTVEVSRVGANLIPYPYDTTTKTTNGITMTDNGDGSITLNGTATADTMFYLLNGKTKDDLYFLRPGEQYVFAMNADKSINKSDVMVTLNAYLNNSSSAVAWTFLRGDIPTRTVTAPEDIRHFYLYVRVASGVTLDNLTLKPQLQHGSVATEFEPYVAPQTVTANADGTVSGLTSLSPNMTIFTNNVDVTINCEYQKN